MTKKNKIKRLKKEIKFLEQQLDKEIRGRATNMTSGLRYAARTKAFEAELIFWQKEATRMHGIFVEDRVRRVAYNEVD